MNFWKNQENNPWKIVLVLVVVALLGYVVYNSMHNEPLLGEGRLTPQKKLPQKNPDDTKTEREPVECYDSPATVTLVSAKVPTATMLIVSTGLSNAIHVPWLTMKLTNPSNCPVDVSQMSFELSSNEISSWPPVQHVQLVHLSTGGTAAGAMVQLDGKKEVPGGVLPDEPIIPVPAGTVTSTGTGSGKLTFVFNFSGAAKVRIAPHSSEFFRLFSNAQNVPANMYGYDGTVGSGQEVWFKFQMTQFLGTTSLGGASLSQTVTGGGIPSTIITPVIKIHE